MADLDLDAIEALLAAATPGPWTISHRCYGKTEMDDESCGLGLEIEQWEEPMRGYMSLSADARLCAYARNDLPALVAEVRRLRDLLARALPHIDPNDNQDAYQLLIECKEATKETP